MGEFRKRLGIYLHEITELTGFELKCTWSQCLHPADGFWPVRGLFFPSILCQDLLGHALAEALKPHPNLP